MNNILLIGGGGHCASVADTLLKTNKYDKIGIVDCSIPSQLITGASYVGNDDDLLKLRKQYSDAFITLGSVGDSRQRERLFSFVKSLNFVIPNIIDPSAQVSNDVKLGVGIFIGKNSVVNAGTVIHNAAILNTSCVIEHNCEVGQFVHVSPGAILCGGVFVGKSTHIGAGATVIQEINIGKNAIVGAGAVVIRDVNDNSIVVGNPAKTIRVIDNIKR